MKVEYEPTYEDYKAAYATYRGKSRASAVTHFILFKAFPLAAAVAIILALVQASRSRVDPVAFSLAPSLLTLTLFVYLNRFSYIRRQVRNLFPAGAKDRKIIAEIGEDEIVTLIPGAIRTEYFWESISLFLASSRVNLLYISPDRFILIPNRVLKTEERVWLHETIARKGIKTKSC